MKRSVLLILVVIFSMGSITLGEVSTKVCRADGNTPFPSIEPNLPYIIYPDIMVGTKLTIIVWSDVNEDWLAGGALVLEEEDMNTIGNLHGRDCEFGECPNSRLPDAGEWAAVWETTFPGIGFILGSVDGPNAGDWYIIDYNAIDIGDCNIEFYNYDVNENDPVSTLVFHHVRTRDFNYDTTVDFFDFAVLASHWQATDCNESDWCQGADLDINGSVDVNDLMLFCEYWLEKTE